MRKRPLRGAPRSNGFTLVELLVVIAIIGTLVALLLPAVQSARESARRTSCANNMKQIGIAIDLYQGANTYYPASTDKVLTHSWALYQRHSWMGFILPFLEEGNLHDAIDFSLVPIFPSNLEFASKVIPTYRCPSYDGPSYNTSRVYRGDDTGLAIGNYVALGATTTTRIWGVREKPDGVIIPAGQIAPADITDGLSSTVLIAESREEVNRVWIEGLTAAVTPFTRGSSLDRVSLNRHPYYQGVVHNEYGPSSMHPGGAYHLIADGSVRFLLDEIAPESYFALTTRAGDEVDAL